MREKRILSEAKLCANLTLEKDGVCIDAAASNADVPWSAYIQCPLQTFWEDAVFRVELSFPDLYPWRPLEVRFAPGVFHPNVAEDGSVCNRLVGDHWSPAMGARGILTSTRALLASPNFSATDLGEADDEEAALAADEAARQAAGRNTPQKLYHYTSRDAVQAISGSHELKASTSGIAGPGVYATALHPTNRTRAEIERNNWGGASWSAATRADFVVELDVEALQEQGYAATRVESGSSRDVWLITPVISSASSIRLDGFNSVISDFDSISSCERNKEAGRLFREDSANYELRVLESIAAVGRQLPGVTRQERGREDAEHGNKQVSEPEPPEARLGGSAALSTVYVASS